MHESVQLLQQFFAKIYQPYLYLTRLTLYHCSAYSVTLKCHEGFFGSTSKHTDQNYIEVSQGKCSDAVRTKQKTYGHLQ